MMLAGHSDRQFDGVCGALGEELAAGEEVGAAIAVDVEGTVVLDAWGGHANRAATMPWAENTIVNLFSVTKTMCSLAALGRV